MTETFNQPHFGLDSRLDLNAKTDTVITLDLAGGGQICVGNDLNETTCFVLVEQGDWFEPDLPFIRDLIEPGMQALDIGANHGLFALTIAEKLAGTGRVVAYEPSAKISSLLRQSRELNGYGTLEIVAAAMSDQAGEGTLFAGSASENASLKKSAKPGGVMPAQETVPIVTLDDEWRRLGEPALDFIKLDVEGNEAEVIRGGQACLSAVDPILVFEVSGDAQQAAKLVNQLGQFGFASYRVQPAMNALVPASFTAFSNFQVNLVAIKAGRAAWLKDRCRLIDEWPNVAPPDDPAWPESWAEGLQALRPGGTDGLVADASNLLCRQLQALTMVAQAGHVPLADRTAAVRACLDRWTALELPAEQPGLAIPRHFLKAEIARLAGMREMVSGASLEIMKLLDRPDHLPVEPFPAAPGWDYASGRLDPQEWLRIQAVELLTRNCCHSVRFADQRLLPILDHSHEHALYPPYLERCRQLMRIRASLQVGLRRNSKLDPSLVNGGFVRQAA